ncbi:taste receptor type 2 member 14-like [Castor canadensis]|jgi:taste receptor type 2|uniref:Taste receptor type 2 n=1 Tax=Castor canadensis TaxID=51338 RepID=A0A8B7TJ43_CASCN|nr:taste receptor type 2 member 14-like [Castor canadensis]
MGGVFDSTFTIIFVLELVIGNLGNGFIALVNCMDWVKRRKMSLVDRILTALAISRIALLWSVIITVLLFLLFPALGKTETMMRMINIIWLVTNHFSIWLATILSIFYFLKIANFSNSIFLYMKWRVKKVVSVTLLVSLVFLFSITVQMGTYIGYLINENERNMSYRTRSSNPAELYRVTLILTTVYISIPFTLSLTTFLLLIFSLLKHMKKMQHNANGSRDASTMAHIKALQNVTVFLLLYSIFFLSLIVQVWSTKFLVKNETIFFCLAAGLTFPSIHSCVLILGNSKLRQLSLLVLWWLGCRFKDVENSGP